MSAAIGVTAAFPRPRQSLGQNFLLDANIARKIVRAIAPAPDDVVVEIGPGRGAITGLLAESGCRLVLVEIDGRLTAGLKERFQPSGAEVIHGDILGVSLAGLAARYGRRIRVAGNIPYHLTSPILFKMFGEFLSVSDCTLMVQKEVALRVVSKPGVKEYGILSVMTALHGEPEIAFDISPNCFHPKPKVTSSILRVKMRDGLPDDLDMASFRAVVRATFGKRRKTLRNSLQYIEDREISPERAFRDCPVSLDLRPEQLSLDDFIRLTRHLDQSAR
ncbi:MAG TPA: 16S rRNA (adenine(1518)-N(6)/adenine(1519)-N(6))-dimethyltransferase RsmA [Bacteroidota bacterium]|nr:16S rRNA (adenine(1518)-N(6)/adenine(1519)-N(6))-dimethyltransferase RsmA [Bacteroidota bacterium]